MYLAVKITVPDFLNYRLIYLQDLRSFLKFAPPVRGVQGG